MSPLRTIKELTHEAIDLLEASLHQTAVEASSERFPSPLALPDRSEILIGEIRNLCSAQNKVRTLILANITTHLAVRNAVPTLLVATRVSPGVCAVNLLLWLASIGLAEAMSPKWSESEFSRLASAAGALASAPLLIAHPTNLNELRRVACSAAARFGIRQVVMDHSPHAALGTLTNFSREFGMGITVVWYSPVFCGYSRHSSRIR